MENQRIFVKIYKKNDKINKTVLFSSGQRGDDVLAKQKLSLWKYWNICTKAQSPLENHNHIISWAGAWYPSRKFQFLIPDTDTRKLQDMIGSGTVYQLPMTSTILNLGNLIRVIHQKPKTYYYYYYSLVLEQNKPCASKITQPRHV